MPELNHQYHSKLLAFMRWRHVDENYGNYHEFSDSQLGTIQPDEIKRWMCQKAFGCECPHPQDRPMDCRSASLKYYKKALSYYMPIQHQKWNATEGEGNPTKSTEVNDLIKRVVQFEEDQSRQQQEEAEADDVGKDAANRRLRDQIGVLLEETQSLKRNLFELRHEMRKTDKEHLQQFQALNKSILRMGVIPLVLQNEPVTTTIETIKNTNQDTENDMDAAVTAVSHNPRPVVPAVTTLIKNQNDETRNTSSLSSYPKTLYDLWEEYMVGIGGRKAAKDLSSTERGRVKHKYHRRKVAWDKIVQMKGANYTATAAIVLIYHVYGRDTTLTTILRKMRNDEKTGGHPALNIPNTTDNHLGATVTTNLENNRNRNATLSLHPRSLEVLWEEYIFGIDGRIPAKDFTRAERARDKHKYHRRKVAWDKIAQLMGNNLTAYAAHTAIDLIYEVYGRKTPLTTMINTMKKDNKTGGHPALQV